MTVTVAALRVLRWRAAGWSPERILAELRAHEQSVVDVFREVTRLGAQR